MKKRTTALLIVLSAVIGLVVVRALAVGAQTASPTPVTAPSPKVVSVLRLQQLDDAGIQHDLARTNGNQFGDLYWFQVSGKEVTTIA